MCYCSLFVTYSVLKRFHKVSLTTNIYCNKTFFAKFYTIYYHKEISKESIKGFDFINFPYLVMNIYNLRKKEFLNSK